MESVLQSSFGKILVFHGCCKQKGYAWQQGEPFGAQSNCTILDIVKRDEIYSYVAQSNIQLPFYLQDWWMSAVCGEANWDIISHQSSGELVGFMPFQIRRKLGFHELRTPDFTPYSGPWLRASKKEKSHHILSEYEADITEMIKSLPSHTFMDLKLSPKLDNALPFSWHGYRPSVLYTYVMAMETNVEDIFSQFNRTVRKELSKGEYSVSTIEALTSRNHLKNHNKNISVNQFEILDRLVLELDDRNYAIRLGAFKNNKLAATLTAFLDHNVIYLLSSSVDKGVGSNMGFYALVWELIQRYQTQASRIDFMGSMKKDIASGFRALSALPLPYLRIQSRVSSLFSSNKSGKQ